MATDHAPVELTVSLGRIRRPPIKQSKKIDISKLCKSGGEGQKTVAKYQSDLDAAFQQSHEMSWAKVAEFCEQAATTACGTAVAQVRLEGREHEVDSLNQAIIVARQKRRDAPKGGTQEKAATRNLERAIRRRRACHRNWQKEWWKNMAVEVEAAAKTGDTKTLYKLQRRLGHRRAGQDVHTRLPANVSDELAAWREQFFQIQTGAVTVVEDAWLYVPVLGSFP
jgi:hypothetical protein